MPLGPWSRIQDPHGRLAALRSAAPELVGQVRELLVAMSFDPFTTNTELDIVRFRIVGRHPTFLATTEDVMLIYAATVDRPAVTILDLVVLEDD